MPGQSRNPSAVQRAAGKEHRTAGAVIGAAGAVDVRGAAEFGGDDHDRAPPHRADRLMERLEAGIEFADLARDDRRFVRVRVPAIIFDKCDARPAGLAHEPARGGHHHRQPARFLLASLARAVVIIAALDSGTNEPFCCATARANGESQPAG